MITQVLVSLVEKQSFHHFATFVHSFKSIRFIMEIKSVVIEMFLYLYLNILKEVSWF